MTLQYFYLVSSTDLSDKIPQANCLCLLFIHPRAPNLISLRSAGTHLVREWNGRTYQVEVLDNGYRFDGKTYPSLTTIAKRITGTHWSGPRFFGLTPKRKA